MNESELHLTGRDGGEAPVVVGLGANQGNPLRALVQALDSLQRAFRLDRVSGLYRTAAVGPAQADFLNAAVLLYAPEPLEVILARLAQMEEEAGRVRRERWGPRPLDLDILWAGERTCSGSSLTVPHVELRKRRFALRPLLDVVPDARDPHDDSSYASILGRLEAQRVERLGSGNWWDGNAPP